MNTSIQSHESCARCGDRAETGELLPSWAGTDYCAECCVSAGGDELLEAMRAGPAIELSYPLFAIIWTATILGMGGIALAQ